MTADPDRWPPRPPRTVRTNDWRDCKHCAHYTSRGASGGTPPWAVCQYWPRKEPATCGNSFSYEHRPYLTEGGILWAWTGGVGTDQANDSTVISQSPKPDRMERSAISPSPPPPTIRPDTGDA